MLDMETDIDSIDSLYKATHVLSPTRLNIYIEGSVSMDGYMNEKDFATQLYQVYSTLLNNLTFTKSDKHNPYNLITANSDTCVIAKIPCTDPKRVRDWLRPGNVQGKITGRGKSDIAEVIKSVIGSTKDGALSILVSDCAFSPSDSKGAEDQLRNQSEDIHSALNNRMSQDPDFCVVVYRLVSKFNGKHYDSKDQGQEYHGDRPYFLWIFGERGVIAQAVNLIDKRLNNDSIKFDRIVAGKPIGYIPYMCDEAAHGYHVLNATTDADSVYTLTFYLDMTTVPYGEDYILDKHNYQVLSNDDEFEIIDIVKDNTQVGYSHKITVNLYGSDRFKTVSPSCVEFGLNQPKFGEQWKSAIYNSEDGKDPGRVTTFGLQSLVDGIEQSYDLTGQYFIVKTLIN